MVVKIVTFALNKRALRSNKTGLLINKFTLLNSNGNLRINNRLLRMNFLGRLMNKTIPLIIFQVFRMKKMALLMRKMPL